MKGLVTGYGSIQEKFFWKSLWIRNLPLIQTLFWTTTPEGKELMRHRILVFATVLGLFAAFTAQAQDSEIAAAFGESFRLDVGGKKSESETPQVIGRITDFAGRSVRTAEVRFVGVEFDEVVSVKSNAFGFYQTAGLTPGRSYFISVHHRKYLFLIPTIEVVVGDEPVEYDFLGELAR